MGFISKEQLAGIMSAVKSYVQDVVYDTKNSLQYYVDEHNYINTTYSDLKKKRDNKELIPGAQYRIIDYQTTTVQPYTESQGIRFDVIVTALDEKTLSEDAKAINHDYEEEEEEFTPFDSSLLEIKYCLDNDIDRFAWADNIDHNIYHFLFAEDTVPIKNIKFEYSKLISLPISQIAGFDCYTFSPEGAPNYIYGIVVDDVVSVAELTDDTEIRGFVQMPNSWGETEDGEPIEIEGEILEQTFEYEENFLTSKVCNGKGVIYYMKDENGCEAPYDFKNITFDGYFTFDESSHCKIEPAYDYGIQVLNNIAIIGSTTSDAKVTIEQNCRNLRLNNISGEITIHSGVQGTPEEPVYFNSFSENIHIYTNEGEIAETSPNIIIRRLDEIQEDTPVIKKGDAENSAVLKGGNNQAISESSVALGKDNIVGLKGWYYKAIQFNTSTNVTFLYLSKTQQIPVIVKSASNVEQEKDIDFILKSNDIVSVVNDSKYDNKYKISTNEIAKYGRIGIKSVDSNTPFPFNKVNTDDDLNNGIFDPEDYSIYCLSKPETGIADMGQDSFVSGYNNKATNGKATAFGYDNHAYGKFSFVEGRGNKAAYAAHAEGRDNVASGEQSHCEGLSNEAIGNHSHSEGRDTTATGDDSHAEGHHTTASGFGSHAEGYNTSASGKASHAEGNYTETTNSAEHAEGEYNVSNEGKTIHSVGIGTKDTDRKNAHEITVEGKHFIYGIGGYDGTNPNESSDLASTIKNLDTKIDTEISNLIDSAPETLDTLKEIADYLENHEDIATGLVNDITELKTNKSDITYVDSLKDSINASLNNIGTILENKADTSGYYPELHVGLSNNLPDKGDTVEGVIGFRASAGEGNSIEDDVANVKELLGDSVVWNQMFKMAYPSLSSNGVTSTLQEDNSIQCSGTLTDSYFNWGMFSANESNHIYLFTFLADSNALDGKTFGLLNRSTHVIIQNGFAYAIHTNTSPTSNRYIGVNGFTIGDEISVNCQVNQYDLTKMFGAGNEPTTIDEFNAFCNQLVGVDLYAYNEGEVLGVHAKGFKSVNDNAWDEEWELGTFNTTTGADVARTDQIRSKNLIKVLPDMEYYVTIPSFLGNDGMWVLFYDQQGQVIEGYNGGAGPVVGNASLVNANSGFLRTAPNTSYIRFYMVYDYGTTYNNDICIRLAHSGYKTDYVAHDESEVSFDLSEYFPYGMHGIGDVRDSATPSKATRRFGRVDLGELNWSYYANYGFYATVPSDMVVGNLNYLIERPYTKFANPDRVTWEGLDKSVTNGLATIGSSWVRYLVIKDSAYTDATTFKAAMSGVYLYYELAEPIETEIDPKQNFSYEVWDFGTEEMLSDVPSMPVTTRTIYGFNATDTIRGNKAKNEEQDARLDALEEDVVRVGDYQPNLSVGLADNLVGHEDATSSEIGAIRRSGGGAILDGNARVESLKGNSVVWNQIKSHPFSNYTSSNNGIDYTIDTSGEYTLNGQTSDAYAFILTHSSNYVSYIAGHKYIVLGNSIEGVDIQFYGFGTSLIGEGIILITESGTEAMPRYRVAPNTTLTNFKGRIRVHDLTQMFGAGNEPNTVEEFYARCPIGVDMNAYNEGEVIHCNVDAVKSVGRNVWDEEWEVGKYDVNNGSITDGTKQIRNANPIPVLPSTNYYCSGSFNWIAFLEYDDDKNFLRNRGGVKGAITTSSDCSYVRFYTDSNYGVTYNNDICINLSDSSINGQYFPYIAREQSLEMVKKYFPNGMRSAGTAHDEIRYNKQTNKWEKVVRIAEVDLGTLNWALTSQMYFRANLPSDSIIPTSTNYNGFLCVKYERVNFNLIYGQSVIIPCFGVSANTGMIGVYDSSYTDAAAFKAAMSGVILYYELAEPIVTEIEEDFNLDYQVWNFGTEQAIVDTPSAPIKADTVYGFNAVDMIREHESEITALQEQIAALQTLIASLTITTE